MSGAPLISVLLPVHNAAVHLDEALASLRTQTWENLEIVAVDDGSSDGSAELLRRRAREEPRLRVLEPGRVGLVCALNLAAAAAKGEFFARMDADDRSRRERLKLQATFLRARPEVGVLGGAVSRFGGDKGVWGRPRADSDLRAALLFESPFAHPAVMLRRGLWDDAAEAGYDAGFVACEDLDLWERFSWRTRFANLPQVVLDYRVHDKQVTRVARGEMARNGARVRRRYMERLGLVLSPEEAEAHEKVVWLGQSSPEGVAVAEAWLRRLAGEAALTGHLDGAALRRVIGRRWFHFCNAQSRLMGGAAWRAYRVSPLASLGGVSAVEKMRFRSRGFVAALRGKGRDA